MVENDTFVRPSNLSSASYDLDLSLFDVTFDRFQTFAS